MTVSVLIPYRPEPSRRALADLVVHRARAAVVPPGEVIVSDDRGENDDLFNHGQAVNIARASASGDVLVILDADTTYSNRILFQKAVEQTAADRRWRMPRYYRRLTESTTARYLQDAPGGAFLPDEIEWEGDGVSWAGIVIVPAEHFDAVGGADERYVGWGADDVALGLALTTLVGPAVRYEGAALHLWHPRDEENLGWHRHSVAERELTDRYMAAAGDPVAMEALLEGKRL